MSSLRDPMSSSPCRLASWQKLTLHPGACNVASPLPGIEFVIIPNPVLARYLAYPSSAVRSAALSLLVTSPSTTRPFSPDVFRILRENLKYLYADVDAKFRNDVLTITKRLLHRLRGGMSYLSREVQGTTPAELDRRRPCEPPLTLCTHYRSTEDATSVSASRLSLDDHGDFLKWYIDFTMTNLQPTSRYQEHTIGLKTLMILLQSGLDENVPERHLAKTAQRDLRWPLHLPVFGPVLHRLLLDLMMDPFEDIRAGAASILNISPNAPSQAASTTKRSISNDPQLMVQTLSGTNNASADQDNYPRAFPEQVDIFTKRARQRMRLSCRADHADGFARGQELAFGQCGGKQDATRSPQGLDEHDCTKEAMFTELVVSLDSQIELARQDIRRAASDSPMHGLLSSLR